MILLPFKRSIFYPIIPVLVLAVIAHFGYYRSGLLENDFFHHLAANVFGRLYFVAVSFGALYVFTRMTIVGASLSLRILASFFVPCAWIVKEAIVVTESFPVAQAAYFLLNPFHIWLILLVVFEMGLATLIARFLLKMKGVDLKVITKPPVFVMISSLGSVVAMYSWGSGENVYVMYLALFRALFGDGI